MTKDNKILSMEELREMATPIIKIPNFDNTGTINVRVQRPRLMEMAKQGTIPNHLLGIAAEMVGGKKDEKKLSNKEILKQSALMMELYSNACLVEPKYSEFKDIMTDEQGDAIFAYAMGEVSELDSFRKDGADDSNDKDEPEIQEESE